MKKTVLYPIEVPTGEHCWEKVPPHQICQYFDNEYGIPTCKFGFYELKDTPEGIVKSEFCSKLKTIKGNQ